MVRGQFALGALVFLLAAAKSHAIGTVAGTVIENTAQVTYEVGASTLSTNSNTMTLRVAEILDVAVTLNSTTVAVTPNATQQQLIFTVTNTGNGTETFSLAGLSTLAGDQFDPTPSTNFIYLDTDGSGTLTGADTLYIANTNDPTLTSTGPGSSIRVIVLNDIPNTVSDGERGRSQLSATALTGTGTPGQVIPNAGDGGNIDAVVGTSGATAQIYGEYIVEALQLSAVKSQSVIDPFGTTNAVPGARIVYQIVITASGTGTASAVVFSDAIPANTTYVPGSLTLNTLALSDAGGNDDAGEYALTPTPRVLVNLGNLTAASGAQTIAFAVTIN